MVSTIDHTSNAVWEKSADGGKQTSRTNVNWVVCLWLVLGCDGVAYTHICCLVHAFPATAIIRKCSFQLGSQWVAQFSTQRWGCGLTQVASLSEVTFVSSMSSSYKSFMRMEFILQRRQWREPGEWGEQCWDWAGEQRAQSWSFSERGGPLWLCVFVCLCEFECLYVLVCSPRLRAVLTQLFPLLSLINAGITWAIVSSECHNVISNLILQQPCTN